MTLLDRLLIMANLPVLLAIACLVFSPELCRAVRTMNELGARLGWVFYRGAMRRLERDRQLDALHALILTSYVQSGDVGGLMTYLGAGQPVRAAGRMIPVHVPEFIVPLTYLHDPDDS